MYWYVCIYNIGVLTVNIEFMWRGLETGERRALASLCIRTNSFLYLVVYVPIHFVPSYICNNSITGFHTSPIEMTSQKLFDMCN
jgi:hypothetical protein